MLFQLLYKLARVFRSRPRFYAYLDERTTKHSPERLQAMLNAKAQKDLRITHRPFRMCQFRKSHDVRLIQLVDVLCGAIHYKVNGMSDRADAASYKVDLMEHVTKEAGLWSLAKPTTQRGQGFDIWHIDLRRMARGVPRT